MSLFGSQSKPSLFGSTQQQQPSGGSLFGNTQTNNQNQGQGSSLFGNTQNNQGGGMFGASTQQNQQPQNSLFGGSLNTQTTGAFGASQPQGQGERPFGNTTVFGGVIDQSGPNRSSVWEQPVEPHRVDIQHQLNKLFGKWNLDSPDCVFQYYFYQQVPAHTIPYYAPGAGEDHKAWEEALAKKPNENALPVLGRGFKGIADRLGMQAKAVEALQARLHEMNDCLSEMLQQHDLVISVRAAEARRKHVALTQRCLTLAKKAQRARNRGYAMDAREEQLRLTLLDLEKKAFDPLLNGRTEEIWARMSSIRARTRVLQDEFQKAGRNANVSDDDVLDEDQLKQVKKVLSDFDSQLSHLKKELEQITKEFDDWKTSMQAPAAGR